MQFCQKNGVRIVERVSRKEINSSVGTMTDGPSGSLYLFPDWMPVGHQGGREKIYSDANGTPLSIEGAIYLKNEIIKAIEDKTFNIRRFLPRGRNTFLFENCKLEYLAKMEWRSNLEPGEPGWMSKGHYRKGIKPAFNQHLKFFDSFDIQNIKNKHIQDWVDGLEVSSNHKRIPY